MLDVCIIGAGIAGCCCARELSRYNLSVQVLEASYDVACGATRTNSGIVHGGYDPVPHTKKAYYNALGAKLIPSASKELGFRYINNGSIVLAFTQDEVQQLAVLHERAVQNNIPDVRIVTKDELVALEPQVNPDVLAGLVCEHSGIVDPFGMCVAYAENAAVNGVEFCFQKPVERITKHEKHYDITLADGQTLQARCVINAAGTQAFIFHNQISAHQLKSNPRKGCYELMNTSMGSTFTHTMFQAPTKMGKGVLISPTVEGNLIVGPTAEDIDDPFDTATSSESLAWLTQQARKTWPHYTPQEVIVNFAGVRPSGADGDFVIGEVEDAPGFFDICAFDSPGLTSAPAVGCEIAHMVAQYLDATFNPNFVAHRAQPERFKEMTREQRSQLIAKDPSFAHIICRCEQVTKGEILACLHAPIPATTIVGIKRRCRAGTGGCQGGFCAPLIAEIIAQETGIGIENVCMQGPGSELSPFKREKHKSLKQEA